MRSKSILALFFIFPLLIFKTTPFYILDKVDVVLDFYYTKNISQLLFQNFIFTQFLIVSLKKQIILDADVVFEVTRVSGKSYVTRLKRKL
jgi:structural maintenance of chromosome 2|mmetsp:Transcript_19819/g.29130  ORF Transcript_19819/g.29130 Transcript_19819/m.29130 type:complete len:90 (-) Transcript_19819:854-1123(-)